MRAKVQGGVGFSTKHTLPAKPTFESKPDCLFQSPVPPPRGERGGPGPGPRADSSPVEGRKEEIDSVSESVRRSVSQSVGQPAYECPLHQDDLGSCSDTGAAP